MARPKTELFTKNEQVASIACRNFGCPARWRILVLLAEQGPMYVKELSGYLPLSAPTVSAHVQRLYQAGYIVSTDRGLYNFYEVNWERLLQARRQIEAMLDAVERLHVS